MKKKLNPELVRVSIPQDRNYQFDENWVHLRDPKIPSGSTLEQNIGEIEIEILEDPEGDEIIESYVEISAGLSDKSSERELAPKTFLSQDCFDFDGKVRLFIHSETPFI
jgi:hypothetical protein